MSQKHLSVSLSLFINRGWIFSEEAVCWESGNELRKLQVVGLEGLRHEALPTNGNGKWKWKMVWLTLWPGSFCQFYTYFPLVENAAFTKSCIWDETFTVNVAVCVFWSYCIYQLSVRMFRTDSWLRTVVIENGNHFVCLLISI